MAKEQEELLWWLNKEAEERFGEFGFTSCSEEEQVEIVYSLVMGIMTAQRWYEYPHIIIVHRKLQATMYLL